MESATEYSADDSFQADSTAIFQLFAKGITHSDSMEAFTAQAIEIAGKRKKLVDFVRFYQARNYTILGNFERADSIANAALQSFGTDTMQFAAGKYLNLKGSLNIYKSNHAEAVEYFKRALQVYETHNDLRQAAAIEFNMAQLFLGNLDYPKVYEYSMSSHNKLSELSDTLYLPIVKGLAALSSAITGKIKDAEKFATEALEMSEQYRNIQGTIFAKYAFGEIATQNQEYEAAIRNLKESKLLAQQANLQQVVLPNNAAILKSYLMLKQYDSAVAIGEESLALSSRMKFTDVRYNLLKNTAKAYAGVGNFQKAYEYMSEAEEHYRFKSNESNQKIIHELLIKYDDEKKSNQILLQQKNIARKNQTVYTLLGLVVLILLGALFYRNHTLQERKLLVQKQENDIRNALKIGEENERARLAGELHDGVASNLIAVKLQLENVAIQDTAVQKSLELIQHTNREIRHLAHRLAPVDFASVTLIEVVKDFCAYCSVPARKVEFITNAGSVNKNADTKLMMYRAIQELVQNSIKHAEASEITVQLLVKEGDAVQILVEDNGCGFDPEDEEIASGFDSLRRRVKMFQGNMDIESEKGKGTSVFINL